MFRMTRDFDLDGPTEMTLEVQRRVLAEDRPIVEAQRSRSSLPLDLSEEFHIRCEQVFHAVSQSTFLQAGLGRQFSA